LEKHIVANGRFLLACQVGPPAGLVSAQAAADDDAVLAHIDPLFTEHDKPVERHDGRLAAWVHRLLDPVHINHDLSWVVLGGRDE
jgi:hypothetical protein